MKRILLTVPILAIAQILFGQATYYWVGSSPSAANANINNNANWNTVVDGSGSSRTSSTGATDILVFNGVNLGGTNPVTGPVTVNANAGITCAQLKFINNVTINMVRPTSGTTTITISGEAGDDFVVEAGSSLQVPVTTSGSLRFAMAAANTGIVSGTLSFITGQQCRIDNTTGGSPGSFRFTSGSSMVTNITSASSSYAFGSSSQSSPNWVAFEAGSHLYYDGGFSPNGSGNLFSAIDMKPGSTWHHRANNPTTGAGNFFNQKSYGHVIVENNATLTALGSIYRIENLTINSGSTFTTHSGGFTVVLGQLLVNGNLMSDPASTNELVMGAPASQTISGSGTINIASLMIANSGNVNLARDIIVDKSVTVHGKLNFGTSRITGNGTFNATGTADPAVATGNLTAGSYIVPVSAPVATTVRGFILTGTGIPSNTSIVGLSPNGDSLYLSNAVSANGAAVSLALSRSGSTLQNNNANGYDPSTGSVALTGTQTFDPVSYIIDGATSWPFGVTTGSGANPINLDFVEVNAPVTVNRAFSVSDHLAINGKLTLRPLDVIGIGASAVINGAINSTNYIVTASNSTTGEVSVLGFASVNSPTLVPIGTANYYLPVTITPTTTSGFAVNVFEGITTNGTVNGTALTATQKQNVVNAVWNINRTSGTGSVGLDITWDAALEGSTFTTLPDSDIGLIQNSGSLWSLPTGAGNNTTNIVTSTVSNFGAFSIGAVPQVQPFVFNPLPTKVYGDPDFNGGATSLNTSQPIIYASSNPSVATIVGGNIHITGAGTTTITASQASDGFYAAASVDQPLTVDRASLTISADNITKFEQQPNPALTVTYTGFVYGETNAVLTTQPTVSTTATTNSAPGTYPITVSGATSSNYDIIFVDGTMTVQAKQNQTITFPAPATKTYGNADFGTGASSTNSTIAITYTVSNPAVATITGNTIHIVGAGTTTITASQAGNAGYFPATDVVRTLTVNKAGLSIRVLDTVKTQGQPNPQFTITYTGFVLGETVSNLATPPSVTTIATTGSPAGYYTLVPGGAVTNNYNITYTSGRLTIYPLTGTSQNHIHAFMSNGNTLTVRVYSTFPALADISIYDLNGKPLVKKNAFLPQGFQNSDIDVSVVPAGIYVVTVRGSGVDLKKTIAIIRYQ